MEQQTVSMILRTLEAAEVNVDKLERVWSLLRAKIPQGICFGSDAEYDELRREYADLISVMPKVKGMRLEDSTLDLNAIAQSRLDAQEIDEPEAKLAVEEAIEQPARDIAEYKYRLRKKRREVVRELVRELVSEFDLTLKALIATRPGEAADNDDAPEQPVKHLRTITASLDRLIGPLMKRPMRWGALSRHLHFGMWLDIADVQRLDWPTIRTHLLEGLYGENDPLPVPFSDLDALEALPPKAQVPTALSFDVLSADDFERLIFSLVSNEPGYENSQWLTRTNAPDRGRDVSVNRVIVDGLGGTRRERTIIQCKHWQQSSVGVAELATLKEQVRLWTPPRVDVLVIATTGRFSSDAVLAIEKHNADGLSPRIEMWADSHMELLLSRRPALITEFGLRPE